ncbi:DNA-binding transcriptional MerR regulator [Kitasatospora sp. MAA4]|uniref:MerR family transcriptional regulator n=1 Tax=Kitasatospora sp. MAA4 TaxID=3035093 RepID=UPI002472EF8E|nr:MerR family transcriptional regulator [Kitasatospora sp. MAA4]MDH6130929.1 DNA-binding transcriptional MerR regulator [Kitasatospora sp. MAA4]
MESTPPQAVSQSDRPDASYTVEEISRLVGMSPRNIRAHQSRKLLRPPARRGRIGYYDETHVRRLQHIVSLQRQGFNLVSIAAFLGAGGRDAEEAQLATAVNRAVRDQPAVFYSLNRHGMLGWEADGTMTVARPAVQRATMELVRTGVAPAAALRCLARSLDRIASAAEDLVTSSSAELIADAPVFAPGPAAARPAGGPQSARLTEGLVELLVSTFRAAAEDRGRELLTELLTENGGSDAWVEEHLVVENG